MTQFLGRQDCIESIRKDLVDLQGTILDVFSRTGPVRFSSWKFPDKLSCNLDMVALLEVYDFVDGEETFNQHSHIVLLELVVDRLLLLLQSFNAYIEQLRCSQRREQTQQIGCLSVGLVVRNYWSNLVQFARLKGDKKHTKPKAVDDTETVSSAPPQLSSKSDSSRHSLAACSSTSSIKLLPQNHVPPGPAHNTLCCLKIDSHNVSCQTFESSLIPCDACHQVQSVLKQTGAALVEMFCSEGLPCSLQPLLAVMGDALGQGYMTAGDVAQWANEQLKDMRRLTRHLQDVRGTVQPLKDRLTAAETEQERFRSQLEKSQKKFKEEREKHQANIVQLEFSLQKAQRSIKETEKRLQEEQQQLRRESFSLEESNSRLKEKIAAQQDALQTLECERNVLQEKVRTLHKLEEEAHCKLQQRIQQLESQISETQVLLDKENAKYHSACRQQESMQAKQKSLLERVDALDQECEELHRQLGKKEGRQIDLHNQLQHMSEEKEQQHAHLTQQQGLCLELQKDKQTLEKHVGELKNNVAELKESVETLRERERLLVAFPELSSVAHAQPQTTGNVLLDMEQQLQANSIRIKVLEQENSVLQRSLEKLRKRAQHDTSWETWSLPSTPVEKQHSHLTHVQKSPLQSTRKAQEGYNKRGNEAKDGQSGQESARSEGLESTAADFPSPSSLQLHIQTFHLNTGSTVTKSHMKTQSASLQSHRRGVNQRRK